MKDFLYNLALFAGIGLAFFIFCPDIAKDVIELFGMMGILPIFIILIIISAIPRRKRRR